MRDTTPQFRAHKTKQFVDRLLKVVESSKHPVDFGEAKTLMGALYGMTLTNHEWLVCQERATVGKEEQMLGPDGRPVSVGGVDTKLSELSRCAEESAWPNGESRTWFLAKLDILKGAHAAHMRFMRIELGQLERYVNREMK